MADKIIQHKRSSVAGNTPSTAQVNIGELAINFPDKSIYTQDAGGNIIELARDLYKSTTAPTTPAEGDIWFNPTDDSYSFWNGSAWIPLIYNGLPVLPTNTSSQVGFGGGSGTSGAPYTYSASVSTDPGKTGIYVDTITVTGLTPGSIVELVDNDAVTNGGRFRFSNNIANSSGELVFTVLFDDVPASAAGAVYTGSVTIGSATTYIISGVAVGSITPIQSINGPTNENPVSTNWNDPDTTLTSTGCIEFSVNGGTSYVTSGNITTGGSLLVRWKGTAGSGTCIDAAHGTSITGDISNSDGSTQNFSLTIDKEPPISWVDGTDQATSTLVKDDETISGINSYAYVYRTTNNSTQLEFSKDNTNWTTMPSSQNNAHYVVNGDRLYVRQLTSSSDSTTTSSAIQVGETNDTFSNTTAAAAGTISQPAVSPLNGTTDVDPMPLYVGSSYVGLNGVGSHASTDWEVYQSDGSTLLFSEYGSSSLTNFRPLRMLANSTEYKFRFRYNSSDSVTSDWSPLASYTVAARSSKTRSIFVKGFINRFIPSSSGDEGLVLDDVMRPYRDDGDMVLVHGSASTISNAGGFAAIPTECMSMGIMDDIFFFSSDPANNQTGVLHEDLPAASYLGGDQTSTTQPNFKTFPIAANTYRQNDVISGSALFPTRNPMSFTASTVNPADDVYHRELKFQRDPAGTVNSSGTNFMAQFSMPTLGMYSYLPAGVEVKSFQEAYVYQAAVGNGGTNISNYSISLTHPTVPKGCIVVTFVATSRGQQADNNPYASTSGFDPESMISEASTEAFVGQQEAFVGYKYATSALTNHTVSVDISIYTANPPTSLMSSYVIGY